jgi:hypothetical protein
MLYDAPQLVLKKGDQGPEPSPTRTPRFTFVDVRASMSSSALGEPQCDKSEETE